MERWMVFVLISCFSALSFSQTLYIGLNADMRGGSARSGEAIKLGASLAIEDINQSGLLGSYKLALKVLDHRGNPARGADNVVELAEDTSVIAILGGLHTPVVMHELPLIHKIKIPYLIPWAAGTPIINNGFTPNYVFRLSVRDEYAGEVLVNHAKTTGSKKIGLLLERTGWGRSNEKSMGKAAKQNGLTVVGIQWFNWGENNFTQQIQALKKDGADSLLLVANSPEGVKAVKAMASLPSSEQLPIISHWGITGGKFPEEVGLDTLSQVDLRVLQTYLFEDISNNKLAKNLLDRYKAATNQTHDFIRAIPGFAHSYDLVQILARAIKGADQPSRSSIRNALESLPRYQGLIRTYQPAFTSKRHEALERKDYSIARYNQQGFIIPWSQ